MNLLNRLRASDSKIINFLFSIYRKLWRIYYYFNLIKILDFKGITHYIGDDKKRNNPKKNYTYNIRGGLNIISRNNSSDHTEMGIILLNIEYRELIRYYKKILGNNLVIIDAGGNIGMFTIYINKYFKLSRSIIIEPDKENLVILNENLEKNNIENYIILPFALYSKETELNFNSNLSHDSKKIDNISGNSIVKTISIGKIFQENGLEFVDILKIDIEGGEWNLLIQKDKEYFNKVKLIIIEYHIDNEDENIESLLNYFDGFNSKVISRHNSGGLIYFKNKNI